MDGSKKLVNFWMDRGEYERVRAKADREHVSLSGILRDALRDWLEGRYRVRTEQEKPDDTEL